MSNLLSISAGHPLCGEPIRFTMAVELVRAAPTPKDMDEWRITLSSDYPGEMVLSYRTGIAHRADYKRLAPAYGRGWTVHNWNASRPTKPANIRGVLHSVGSDYAMARDMPRDEADACDHLAEEGIAPEGKPGETLRMVRALNKAMDDVRALLTHTGIKPDHFADWCISLED